MAGNPIAIVRNGMLPSDWQKLSAPEKLQRLYGESLDSAWIALTYAGEDRTKLLMQNAVRHDIMMIAAKFALSGAHAIERSKVLETLAEGLAKASRSDRGGRPRVVGESVGQQRMGKRKPLKTQKKTPELGG